MAATPTTVPFRYHAELEINAKISSDAKERQAHTMVIQGYVHPDPYDMDTAMALARDFLAPQVAQGWTIVVLQCFGYRRG